MSKTRLNISLDQDLAEFAKVFAAENRTSVAEMVTQYLLSLKRRSEGKYMEKFWLARPSIRRWKMLRPNCMPERHNGIHTTRSSETDEDKI